MSFKLQTIRETFVISFAEVLVQGLVLLAFAASFFGLMH